MASASWALRRWEWRSVVRRSCPKFESQLLVRSRGHRSPSGTGFLACRPVAARLGMITSVSPRWAQAARTNALIDEEPLEMHGLDIAEQASVVDGVELVEHRSLHPVTSTRAQ